MSRFNRFEEFLTVALMSAALSLPVSAEEITVTVPPDPPAQNAIAPAPATPHATSAAGNMKTSQAPDDTTDQDAQTPPASPVEHKAEEKHPEMKAKSEPAAANKVDKPSSTTKKSS